MSSYYIVSLIFATIILVYFWRKIIVPFSQKMLSKDVQEQEDLPFMDLFADEPLDEENDNLDKKIAQLKKKLDMNEIDEQSIRYDVLLEKIKQITKDNPEEFGLLLKNLSKEA